LQIRVSHAPALFACLAGAVSAVSFTLALLFGWGAAASLWGAVAGAALCGLIAILAPALEAGAALLMRKGGWATLFAFLVLWPGAISMELLVVSVDLGAIAARSDETEAVRQRAIKQNEGRDAKVAVLRRILNEDSAELVAARKIATAAEDSRKAECIVRGPRCRDAESAERDAVGKILEEARNQTEARKKANDELESARASATQGPLVAAINPLQRLLEPLIGAWAGTFVKQLQLALALATGFGRLLLIAIAALMRDPPASLKRQPLRLGWRMRWQKRPMPALPVIGNPIMIVRSVLVASPGVRTSIEAAYAHHKARCAAMGLAPLPARTFSGAARDFAGPRACVQRGSISST
jgi:hypothetical protein